jgi:hypothetical protein
MSQELRDILPLVIEAVMAGKLQELIDEAESLRTKHTPTEGDE